MIRFSARGAYLLLFTFREGAYSKRGAYLYFKKHQNVQNKVCIFIWKGSWKLENGLIVPGSFLAKNDQPSNRWKNLRRGI